LLRSARAARVLGITLPAERIETMLKSLGLPSNAWPMGFA
jgi:phenylalanyl-tRNA synthetase beta subunit